MNNINCIKLNKSNSYLFVLIFIIVTIYTTTTNKLHYTINRYVLMGVGILFAIAFFGVVCKKLLRLSVHKNVFRFTVYSLLLYLYPMLLAIPFGGIVYFYKDITAVGYLVVSFLFTQVIYREFFKNKFKISKPVFIKYFIAVAFIVFFVGAFNMSFPPSINFVLEEGVNRWYSQGFTAFYCMGTISSVTWLRRVSGVEKLAPLILTVFFFLLVLLGGARGELLACIIIVSWIIVQDSDFKTKISFILLICMSLFLIFTSLELLEGIRIFDRLTHLVTQGDDARVNKYLQVVSLIDDRPECLIVGCGINYYQTHFGFQLSGYAHNLFIEIAISYGVLGFLIIFMSLVGIAFSIFSWGKNNAFFYILLFKYITFLKSGYLLSFMSLPVFVFFSYIGFGYALQYLHDATSKSDSM